MANNIVNGIIYDEFNTPMINVTVQAYDKDLRSAQLLGDAATDVNGFYTISYDTTKYADSDYKTADIFIRLLNANGILLGESPVNFNVPAEFVLDFKIGNTPIKGLNEFDKYSRLRHRRKWPSPICRKQINLKKSVFSPMKPVKCYKDCLLTHRL